MRRSFTFVFFLFILVPNMAQAEYEIPGHRWTVGYDNTNGPTLRRFLGENWEISLSGGPDDYKHNSDSSYFQLEFDEPPILNSDTDTENKSERGFITLGLGRKLLRENRFWLTGSIALRYTWENGQNKSYTYHEYNEEYRTIESIGHEMSTALYFGLRPAYDITTRIVLYVDFGFYIRHSNGTSDSTTNRLSDGQMDIELSHNSDNRTYARVYGANNISSVGIMFRF